MDELDILFTKWGTMTPSEQVIVILLVLGGVVGTVFFALNQGHEFYQRVRGKHTEDLTKTKLKADMQKGLSQITVSGNEKEELEKLIKPLYLSLDSNRDNPIKGAHLAFEDIKRYGNLAQPELRNLLHQYCDIRDEWENTKPEDQAPTFQLYHQRDLKGTVNQIYDLTKQRYEELMWEKKEC